MMTLWVSLNRHKPVSTSFRDGPPCERGIAVIIFWYLCSLRKVSTDVFLEHMDLDKNIGKGKEGLTLRFPPICGTVSSFTED